MIKEKKTLMNNTFSLYAMNIVKLIFPLLTLPYLTRILSTETYGVVTYVKSLIVYVQLFLDFGFLLSATKNIVVAKNNKKMINSIIGNTLFEKIILGVFVSILYIIACIVIPLLKNNFLFCIMYLLSVLVTIFILDFLYRGIEKMNLVAIPYIVSKIITLICTFLLVKNDNNIMLIPILELIGNSIAAIISILFLKIVKLKISFNNIKNFINDLKESSIYFISNFATTIFGALTTIVAGFYVSIEEIAFWGICMQILSAAKALYNPLTNSLYPYMIRKKDLKLVNKISNFMIIPMFIGIIIVVFENELVMQIIGGTKYIAAGHILIYLLPAFVFSFYSMLYGWPVLGAIDKVKETSASTVIASLFQIMGLLFLIILNKFNLKYLALCCSFTEFILFVIRIRAVYKNKEKFKINKEGVKYD